MTTALKPGRQRSQAADDAILSATLDLLRQHGYQGLTMVAVIERSGVSSATLYRRWPDKQALVLAALRTLTTDPVCSARATLAGDIESLVKRISRAMATPDELFAVLATEVKHSDEMRAMNREAFIEPRLEQVKAILARAVERGELATHPPAEVVLSLVTGPLYHRTFILGEKATPSFQRTVVHHLLAGLGQ